MIVLLLILLFSFMVVYVMVFAVIARPRSSLYAYLALWVIVPKAFRLIYLTGGAHDLPEGVTAFNILEGVAVLGIVVAMLLRRKMPDADPDVRPLKRFALLLLASGVVSLVVPMGGLIPFRTHADGMWQYIGDTLPSQYRILPVLSMLYGAVFLYGCARFIRTREDTEPFFWIFALSGVELAIERVAFVNLSFFGELNRLAIEKSGRFNSLVFTGYDLAGVFAILAVASSLYLALRGRRVAWVMFAIAWVPIIGGYQRAVLLGGLAAVALVYWLIARRGSRVIVITAGIAFALAMVVTGLDRTILTAVGRSLGGEVRPEYFRSETFDVRLALWKRAYDTFHFLAPFGAGPGMTATAMNYPIPDAEPITRSALASDVYSSLELGTRTTNAHNAYIELVVEHGIPGLALLLGLMVLMGRLWRRRLRPKEGTVGAQALEWPGQACAFAMLVGLGIHGIFEATPTPYALYFLGMYLALIMRVSGRKSEAADSNSMEIAATAQRRSLPV